VLVVEKTVYLNINDERDGEEAQEKEENFKNNILKISQSEINDVKTTKTMDITEFKTEFEKILDSKLSDKAEFSQEAVANVASHVIDKIREKDEEWKAERESIETEKIQAQRDAEEAKSSIEDLQNKLEEASEKITSLESSIDSAQAEELFNSRMESVDDLYDLTDQDRGVLAKEIRGLDTSEAVFEEYHSKLASLLQHKSKAFKVEQEKQFETQVQEAVEKRLAQQAAASDNVSTTEPDETVEDVVENVEVPHSSMANNNEASSVEESLEDKFKRAFSAQNISITY
jgi:chromosome segregation ATPase